MIIKIIVLCVLLKMCFLGFSIFRCAVQIVRRSLKFCVGLFLLWLLLYTI